MNTGNIEKMSGHWLLAKVGKKVLRPGGKVLTLKMLDGLSVGPNDDVAEFAPGLGFTAQKVLEKNPKSYVGIDADNEAIAFLKNKFRSSIADFENGNAAETGLKTAAKTKVYGEAMLTMHVDHRKSEIIREANRILKPNGLYAIHELALTPDSLDENIKKQIQRELAEAIKVNARPLTLEEWKTLLRNEGFRIVKTETAPMHLLKSSRIISDEGLGGFLKIVKNIFFQPEIKKRILEMRNIFRKHEKNMCAVMIIAAKQ